MAKFRLPGEHGKDLTTLPAPAFARLMLAVFFSIGAAIICTDLMDSFRRPLWWTLTRAGLIGVVTAASLTVAGRSRRALLLVLPMAIVLVTGTLVTARMLPPNLLLFEPGLDQLRQRMNLEGALAVLGMSLGYGIFLRTLSTEVSRHIRTRAELTLAEQVQQSLAPPLSIRTTGYELHGRSQPSSQMGGDLLDAVEQSGALTVYLADVAGHGIQAGVFMGMVKSSVRMALEQSASLAELLTDLNRVLAGVKTSPATYVGFTCIRCAPGGAIEYSIAGSGPILHYQARSGTVARLAMEQFPLGLFPKADFRAGEIHAEPGDILALMTDGIPETADAQDEQLGFGPMEALLSQHATGALTAGTDAVFAAARKHGSQSDDETLALIRVG